ncbi:MULTISPECIES: hypothetical protein [Streptomyces]|uniref:DUF8129 domain-containing protein n=1 Tax=Streptomyces cacaoi TaxID=1898 RepID=A0A4Y3QV45_STRCI|nr:MULTISPECIES: hypothetical protein [Streptomyces]NNG87132.1 hypothetical protein [Streptomyces cacaoi]QHF94914.1 hypothetical protein DEH18_14825 [Streptomyces sp. NHF165]GEB48288.1 hypothetical protein SCA03_08390 [Streptomyces cacaoi]
MSAQQSNPLPLPDYDQLPAASIEHRIRPLESGAVRHLLEHERAHADRPQVVAVLEARLEQLAAGGEPSGGDPAAGGPDVPDATSGSSPVSPDSAAEPTEPLRHGKYRMP